MFEMLSSVSPFGRVKRIMLDDFMDDASNEFGDSVYARSSNSMVSADDFMFKMRSGKIHCMQILESFSDGEILFGFSIVIHPLMLEGDEEGFREHFKNSLKVW